MVSRDALIIFEENVLAEVSSQQADPSFVKQLKDFEKKNTKKEGGEYIYMFICLQSLLLSSQMVCHLSFL